MTEIQEILEENKVQAETFCEWFDSVDLLIAFCKGYATKFKDPIFNMKLDELEETFLQEVTE